MDTSYIYKVLHTDGEYLGLETEVYKTPGLVGNSEPVLVLSLVLFKRNPVYPPGDVLVNIRVEGEMETGPGPILYRDSTKTQSVNHIHY